MKTYDVVFVLETDKTQKGFKLTQDEALYWISDNWGLNLFADYQGGMITVVCNETSEVVYEEAINEFS